MGSQSQVYSGLPNDIWQRCAMQRSTQREVGAENPFSKEQGAKPMFQLERCALDEIWAEAEDQQMACSPCTHGDLSIGSAGHCAGTCTPCKFHRSRRGCHMGTQCNLCHYPHEELTHSAIRRAMRRSALAKREQRALEAMEVSEVASELNYIEEPHRQ